MSQKDKILLQKLNLHANQTLNAVIDWDLNHNVTFWNNSAERIFGFKKEEVLQKDGFELVVPNYISKDIDEIWDLLIKNKGGNSSVNENVTKSGETIICKWYNTPLLDSDNNVISVTSLVMDITKEKRQEKIEKILYEISKLSIIENNLSEFIGLIRKKLSEIIDTTNFLIAFVDKKANTIYSPFVSDEKDDIEVWPYDSKSMSSYIIKNNISLLVNKKEINKLINDGKIELVGIMPEVFLAVPLLDNNNETIGVIAVQSYENKNAYSKSDLEILDFVSNQLSSLITRKKAQDELKIALDKAKESDRMKSVFLATMSHELRTPLNAIIGFSELMSEGLDSEKNIKFSEIIHKSGLQLFQLVNDIFDVTLLESGVKKATKEKQPLIPILEHVKAQIITEKIKIKKDIRIKLEYDDLFKDVEINTDKFKLQQVLINLLKNSLKFTKTGGISFGFTEAVFKNKNYIKFFIKDTGIGISKRNLSKIFDRFTQLEDKYTRQYDGAGIGLSLSKKIVDLLEGEIWVDSELGKGSTFYFTIPFDKKGSDEKINLNENLIEQAIFKGKTILIAEDEMSNYQYLKVLLKKTEANIIWVKNGQGAIDICKEGKTKIDLILMDLKMPKKSGIKATIEIKKMNPKLPIIAQTAFANMEDKEKALKAGCDDFLTKPIERNKLIKTIYSYL